MYLRTVFARIACQEASLFRGDLYSCTSASTFYKLLEIERSWFELLSTSDDYWSTTKSGRM